MPGSREGLPCHSDNGSREGIVGAAVPNESSSLVMMTSTTAPPHPSMSRNVWGDVK